MKTSCLLLLMVFVGGCGYSSKGSGAMAPGAPAIASLTPSSVPMGGSAFTLTVTGTNFANGATVYWNGTTRSTTFVSATQLTASINAADIATAQTIPVYVRNPGGTGIYMNQTGHSSASVSFTVSQ
jgi:trimeric autotransporter adhesin